MEEGERLKEMYGRQAGLAAELAESPSECDLAIEALLGKDWKAECEQMVRQ